MQAGATTAVPPTWCNRSPGSLATPAILQFYIVDARANGRARCSPAASREKTWPVEGRQSPPHSSSPIAGARAESCAAARRRRDGYCGLNTEINRRSECRRRRVRRALRDGSSSACAAAGACRSPAPHVPPLVTLRQFFTWYGSRGRNGACSPPLQSGKASPRQNKVTKRERRRRAEKGGR